MTKGLSNVSIALGSDIMRERDAQMGDDIELKTINVCEINFFNTYSLDDGIIEGALLSRYPEESGVEITRIITENRKNTVRYDINFSSQLQE